MAGRFVSAHFQPLQLSAYSDPTLGVGVSTSDPGDDSAAQVAKDMLSFNLHFSFGPQVEHAVALFALLSGMALIGFGVRLFRPLLFATSWLFIGGLTFFISMLFCKDSTKSFIAGSIIGFVGGLVMVKLWRLSLALVGAASGFVLWLLLQSLWPSLFPHDGARYLVLACLVVLCGALAVRGEKTALLACTPLLGAFLLLQGLDHFVKAELNAFRLLTPEGAHNCAGAKCFGLYAALVALSIIGWYVQLRWTAKDPLFGKRKAEERQTAPGVRNSKNIPELMVFPAPSPLSARKGASSGFGNPFAQALGGSDDSSSSYGGGSCYTGSSLFSKDRGGNPFASRRNLYNAPTTPEFYEG